MYRVHTVLLFCYPPAVHFALISSQADSALYLLCVVSISQLLITLSTRSGNWWTATIPAAVLVFSIIGLFQGSVLALYLPPIIISSGLLWLFGSTLRRDREPLITSIARIVFKEKSPEVLHYTRRVTQIWSLFFFAMLMETTLLALFAPIELWSLFANILNYLFILLFFVMEFSYRRLRFAQRTPIKSLIPLLKETDWKALMRNIR